MKIKQSRSGSVTAFDWIAFAVLAAICFFCFQQGDLFNTAGSSFALLNGHILDFYDYNASLGIGDAYLISTYVLFAIWNIPIRLLGLVTAPTLSLPTAVMLWNKLLPTLFFFGSAALSYRMLLLLGADRKQAKIGAYIFLSSPIAFFSQFIFGQYDSLTLFFMMAGIYYWLRDKRLPFILFFGLALTFKYTALLIFIPLLLLREKRYLRIILSGMLVAVPFLVMNALYLTSPAFTHHVGGFNAVGYILGLTFTATYFPISATIVLFLLICGVAFFRDCKDRAELFQWGLFLSSLVCFVIFGLCQWHPQWLMFMTPFLAFGVMYNRKAKDFLFIEFLLMGAFVLVTVTMWNNHVDQRLFEHGVLGELFIRKGGLNSMTMHQLFLSLPLMLSFSAFTGILLILTVYKHPRYLLNHFSEDLSHAAALIRVRLIGGVAVFMVPAFLLLGVLLARPDILDRSGSMAAPLDQLNPGQVYQQHLTYGADDTVSAVSVAVGTYGLRGQSGRLTVELYDAATDTLLAEGSVSLRAVQDNRDALIRFAPTKLTAGAEYDLLFQTVDDDGETSLTIYRTAEASATESRYAVIDGDPQDYNLCYALYGRPN